MSHRPHRPRRRGRCRPGRAVGRAAPGRRRPPGDPARARARPAVARPGWCGRRPEAGYHLRHRADGAHHAGPDRRLASTRSARRWRDWLDADRCDPALPRALRRRLAASTCTLGPDGDGRRDRARSAGRREAAGYRRYVDFVSRLYRLRDARLHRPQPRLAARPARARRWPGWRRSAASGGSRRRSAGTSRTRGRSGSSRFQAMYAGLSPYDALAIYAVIAYMDSVAGRVLPGGGMHAVPRAMAGAAEKHGVDLRYGTAVTRVELQRRAGRARCITADGERIAARRRRAQPRPARRPRAARPPARRPVPAALLPVVLRAARPAPDTHLPRRRAPHDLFGHAWREVFDETSSGPADERPVVPRDAARRRPTRALAPTGRSVHYVLFPTPNLDAGQVDWDRVRGRATASTC